MIESSNKSGRAVMVRCDTCWKNLFSTAIPEYEFGYRVESLIDTAEEAGWQLSDRGKIAKCPKCVKEFNDANDAF